MKHAPRRPLAMSLPALLLLAVAGCRDADAPITGRGDTYDQPWLTLGSTELKYDTRVGDATRVRDQATGILSVSVPVRNVTDEQLYVEYRMTFQDANGTEVNRFPGTLAIPAKQTRNATGNATSDRADRFRLELNYPRVN